MNKHPAANSSCCDRDNTTLIPPNLAIAHGLSIATPVTTFESVPLDQALGRILALDAASPIPLPPFNNSAMDGYLVRASDLTGDGPWELAVAGRIAAGDTGNATPKSGTCWRILTGAPVPDGFDTVIMQEDVTRTDQSIYFTNLPKTGQHVRAKGGDAAQGQVIVTAGTEIGVRQIAALAAIGFGSVSVFRKIRIALISTGNELRMPGETLGHGQIWNSNQTMFRALLRKNWIELVDIGDIPDNPTTLENTMKRAAETCDMIVTTGGVSVGEEDHMPRVFAKLGGVTSVRKVAIKPGKPVTFGMLGDAIYIGLPGNPVSAFVTWVIIGAQIANHRAGLTGTDNLQINTRLSTDLHRHSGRMEFRPAKFVKTTGDVPEIELLESTFSARIALLSLADGLAVIPANVDFVGKGDLLEFIPF